MNAQFATAALVKDLLIIKETPFIINYCILTAHQKKTFKCPFFPIFSKSVLLLEKFIFLHVSPNAVSKLLSHCHKYNFCGELLNPSVELRLLWSLLNPARYSQK